eukprot:7091761-Pyramimonas_sp.AAC.1
MPAPPSAVHDIVASPDSSAGRVQVGPRTLNVSLDLQPFHDGGLARATDLRCDGELLGLVGGPAAHARRRQAEGQGHRPMWKELGADVDLSWV